jgi:hypothetical protein
MTRSDEKRELWDMHSDGVVLTWFRADCLQEHSVNNDTPTVDMSYMRSTLE